MTFRRFLIAFGGLLVLFLSLYTWNRNSHVLDKAASSLGLEAVGFLIEPLRDAEDACAVAWRRYVDLVSVREENEVLKAKVRELEAQILGHREDMAELARLRELLQLPVDDSWTPVGARVLAARLGPNSMLDSITINRGYATGASPGTPIVTHKGLVGRVLRASPHTSTALLLTNPGSRIAVFTQESRSPGVLTGEGAAKPLAVRYMQRATKARQGEILITSGLDGKYPKGIPVARILSIAPSNYTEFMTIYAEPLVDMHNIEEVMLLEATGIIRPPMPLEAEDAFIGPPLPDRLRDERARQGQDAPGPSRRGGF